MADFQLQQHEELRLETKKDGDVTITLLEGTAEVFGCELAIQQPLRVKGHSLAVFTWDGCRLRVEGTPELIYTSNETPNTQYLNTHQVLQNLRQQAKDTKGQGPRVMVVGPTDTGKSSLCKMLLNWAVRSDYQPTYIDLDIGQGSVTAPGCLAATPIEAPITVEDGYPTQAPLVYYFGDVSPDKQADLYKHLVDRLANVLDSRADTSPEVAAAGMVINTMGYIDGVGFELLAHAVAALQVDVVLVMDQDRLLTQLTERLKDAHGSMGSKVSLVKLPKSGGVSQRQPQARQTARHERIQEYFYGSDKTLHPSTLSMEPEKLRVFRLGSAPRPPSSALPLGQVAAVAPIKVTPVLVTSDLDQSLLAVSHAQVPEQLLSSNIAGFVHVHEVDVKNNTVTVMLPTKAAMPGSYLLAGNIKIFMAN